MIPIDHELFFQPHLEDNFDIIDANGKLYFRYEYEPKYKLSIHTWCGEHPDEMIVSIYW